MSSSSLLVAISSLASIALATAALAEPVQLSSIGQAIALAERNAPALEAKGLLRDIARAEQTQARLLPNPEASVEAEDLVGSGAYRGGRSTELSLRLSQRLELGGKRGARIAAAEAGEAVAVKDYETAKLELGRMVGRLFVEAVAAGKAARLANSRVELAEGVLQVAQERVGAGKESPLQTEKAEVALASALIVAERAEREAEIASKNLETAVGANAIALAPQQPWFDQVTAVNELTPDLLGQHPELGRFDAELARAKSNLRQEQAAAIPDVSLQAGVRRIEETNDQTLLLGFSVPIPVFNRNQGAIEKARLETLQVEREREVMRRQLRAGIAEAVQQLAIAQREISALRQSILPGAERTFAATREGFAAGKFSFLELLDAQRTVAEAQQQLNEALKTYHLRRIDLARLSGVSLAGE